MDPSPCLGDAEFEMSGGARRWSAWCALAAMFFAAVGVHIIHPALHCRHGHDACAYETPASADSPRGKPVCESADAPHDDCMVCAFLAAFHCGTPPAPPGVVSCALLRSADLPAKTAPVRILSMFRLGARGPPSTPSIGHLASHPRISSR
jgi:hypothetical protein